MAWWSLSHIEDEMDAAQRRYGPFTSTHEAYGVLAEEVAELLEAVRSNDAGSIAAEAVQVAAVAARLAEQCSTGDRDFLNRSGC